MNKSKFSKLPLTQEQKEKMAENFVNLTDKPSKEVSQNTIETPQKESVKPIYLRAPQGYWNDIQEIMALTGLSMNAICLELLRPALKKKLKELKED